MEKRKTLDQEWIETEKLELKKLAQSVEERENQLKAEEYKLGERIRLHQIQLEEEKWRQIQAQRNEPQV